MPWTCAYCGLACPAGFEPAVCRLGTDCSIRLSNGRVQGEGTLGGSPPSSPLALHHLLGPLRLEEDPGLSESVAAHLHADAEVIGHLLGGHAALQQGQGTIAGDEQRACQPVGLLPRGSPKTGQ